MPSENSKKGKKGPGFISKFMMLGVLPVLYAIGLGVVILNFSGISLSKQLQWVESHTKPLIKNKETAAETKQVSKEKAASTPKVATSNNENKKTPTASKTNVNNESSAPQATTAASTPAAPSSTSTASSLANIDPETAAKLLSNMSEADALRNLKSMKSDTQSAIIAQMPADEAAKLTVALETGDEPAATTSSSSQLYKHMKPDQIAAILKGISNNAEVLRQIKQMDPDTASKVLSQLDPKVAGWIVTQMN